MRSSGCVKVAILSAEGGVEARKRASLSDRKRLASARLNCRAVDSSLPGRKNAGWVVTPLAIPSQSMLKSSTSTGNRNDLATRRRPPT